MTTITLGSNTYNLVTLPTSSAPAQMELGMTDSVAVVQSPYVPSQMQTQQWPGADAWDATITLPPLTAAQAADWEGFLAELRGPLNVFQIGDPRRTHPLGVATGTPTVAAGATLNGLTLPTTGWTVSVTGILLRGDMIQVGYRLYRVCETVNSDSSGNATLAVWPSLREVPAASAAVTLTNPVGAFRLAAGRRASQFSPYRLTTMSFKATEVR